MTARFKTEAGLENAFKDWAKTRPEGHFFKVVGGLYQDSSQPDICMGWLGRYVAIEFKTPGRLGHRLSILLPKPEDDREKFQQLKINEIIKKGSIAFFSDDLQATQDFLLSLPTARYKDWFDWPGIAY
jgi:hypothetical protein